jgi:methylmalonyl-CoA/ethylmalonyl-CoA epimerase
LELGIQKEPRGVFTLDHIGIQVADLDAAIQLFGAMFGYAQATAPVHNTRQSVRVVFLEKDGSLPLKLFQKVDTEGAPVATRGGAATLHHLAFRTGDMNATLQQMEGAGARILVPPQPGEAFENEPIAFVHIGMGINTELIATGKRAARLQPAIQEPQP